jgi:hypothetical protein
MPSRNSVVSVLSIFVAVLAFLLHQQLLRVRPLGPALSYKLTSESGMPLRSVFEGMPVEARFVDMGKIPAKPLPCKAQNMLRKITNLFAIPTAHAQDDGCTGSYWTGVQVLCLSGCIVDDTYPLAYLDSTVAGPCDGKQPLDGYCGACDLTFDTPWCDSCGG